MAGKGRGSRRQKPKTRNLDKKNTRQTSNPTGKQEKIKAIGDNVEGKIRAYLPQMVLESELRQRDMAEVLGVGGPSLELFIDEFQSGYAESTDRNKSEPYDLEKEQAPGLKLESQDVALKFDAGDDVNFDASPDKKTARKPKRNSRRRK